MKMKTCEAVELTGVGKLPANALSTANAVDGTLPWHSDLSNSDTLRAKCIREKTQRDENEFSFLKAPFGK